MRAKWPQGCMPDRGWLPASVSEVNLQAAGREYTQADSRYATRDSFVISMEAVTAFIEGPACFVTVWAILQRKPWAYTLQILISCGQIYGDILYFGTTILEGRESQSDLTSDLHQVLQQKDQFDFAKVFALCNAISCPDSPCDMQVSYIRGLSSCTSGSIS